MPSVLSESWCIGTIDIVQSFTGKSQTQQRTLAMRQSACRAAALKKLVCKRQEEAIEAQHAIERKQVVSAEAAAGGM
jgi:hypothetical protein